MNARPTNAKQAIRAALDAARQRGCSCAPRVHVVRDGTWLPAAYKATLEHEESCALGKAIDVAR